MKGFWRIGLILWRNMEKLLEGEERIISGYKEN